MDFCFLFRRPVTLWLRLAELLTFCDQTVLSDERVRMPADIYLRFDTSNESKKAPGSDMLSRVGKLLQKKVFLSKVARNC